MIKSRWQAETDFIVEFYDLDIMNIVWHGNFAKYIELGRRVLLESISYGYEEMKASGYAWPVIEMNIRYIKPLTFKQRVKVKAYIQEYEFRLKIGYLLEDYNSGERLAKAFSSQVAVSMASQEMCLASPSIIYERLGIEQDS